MRPTIHVLAILLLIGFSRCARQSSSLVGKVWDVKPQFKQRHVIHLDNLIKGRATNLSIILETPNIGVKLSEQSAPRVAFSEGCMCFEWSPPSNLVDSIAQMFKTAPAATQNPPVMAT